MEVQVSIGKDQLIASKKSKIEYSSMEDIEETQEKEVNSTNPDHFVDFTEESEEEILLVSSDQDGQRRRAQFHVHEQTRGQRRRARQARRWRPPAGAGRELASIKNC